jgi:hypothetical protein
MTDYISEFKAAIPKAIAQAWSDPAFDSLLLSNPGKAMSSLGVVLPSDVHLRFIKSDDAELGNWTMVEADGKQLVTVPLPPAPAGLATDDDHKAASCSSSSICCTG